MSKVRMPPAWVMGFNARKHGYSSDHHPPLGRDFTAGDLRTWRAGWSDADAIIQAEGEGSLERWNRREGWEDEGGGENSAVKDAADLLQHLLEVTEDPDAAYPNCPCAEVYSQRDRIADVMTRLRENR